MTPDTPYRLIRHAAVALLVAIATACMRPSSTIRPAAPEQSDTTLAHLPIGELYEQLSAGNSATMRHAANAVFIHLYRLSATDTLYQFPPRTDTTAIAAITHCRIGQYEANRANYDVALRHAQKALPLCRILDDRELLSDCLGLLSLCHLRKGDILPAADMQRECYDIDIYLNDKERQSASLNNLAGIYQATDNPQKAYEYVTKAIEIERVLKRNKELAIRLGLASDICHKLDSLDAAMAFAQEAYKLDNDDRRHTQAAIRQTQIANIYVAMHKYNEAKAVLGQASSTFEKNNRQHSLAISLNLLGEILLAEGDTTAALAQFNHALQLTLQCGSQAIERMVRENLWHTYRHSEPSKALEHMEMYTAISDSIFHNETQNRLDSYSSVYNKSLTADLANLRQQHNKILYIAIGIIVLFLLITIGVLVYALSARLQSQRISQNLNSTRNDFIVNVTHEFRSPLTIISGLGNDLINKQLTEKEHQRNIGRAIVEQSNSMLSMVENLIEISDLRLNGHEHEWRHGNIIAYLQMTIDTYADDAAAKQTQLRFESDLVELDMDFVPEYIERITGTLILCALKFISSNGTITLRATQIEESLRLTCHDNGAGIPPEEMPKIFDSFYRSSDRASDMSTGISLALIKHMTELMHGTIEAHSAPADGTTFTITMPLKHGNSALRPLTDIRSIVRRHRTPLPMPELPPLPTDDNKQTVLIVDSNNNVSNYIAAQLRGNYNIHFARNGYEGIEQANRLMPDAIITELLMPDKDGNELCQYIRSSDTLNHIPIIVLTVRQGEADRIRSLESGADAYMTKPFNSRELNIRLRKLIDMRRILRTKKSAVASATPVADLSIADSAFLTKFVDVVYSLIPKGDTSIDTIAGKMGVKRTTLSRRIQQITGETAVNYIIQIKLNKAKRLLDSPDMLPVGDIAITCGFEDNGYFSRVFKQMYNMTPSQYRKRVRKDD